MSEAPPPEDRARLAEELAAELARLRVEDAIVSTLMTVSSIGFRHVAPAEPGAERDLDQARLAIETMRALVPLLEPTMPAELLRDLNAAIASLQLAYAQAIAGKGAGEDEGGDPPPG